MASLAASLKSITNSVWNRRTVGNEEDVKANGTDLFLTAGVTKFGESNLFDVDLCGEDEQLSGVIVGQADDATNLDKDSDDTFGDGVNLKMGVPIPGEEMYLTAKVATTITYGKVLQCDGGFFEDTDFAANESAANVPYAGSLMFQAIEARTSVSGLTGIILAKRV